jgi:hypothetical protein
MTQREVTDTNNTRWTCVQALAGTGNEELAEKAKDQAPDGKVPVVCTPTGGAQSVRIELPENWLNMDDQQLVQQIEQASQ